MLRRSRIELQEGQAGSISDVSLPREYTVQLLYTKLYVSAYTHIYMSNEVLE